MMRLTKLQRSHLEFSRRYRNEPLILGTLLWAMKFKYLAGALYFGASAVLTYAIWGVFPPILLAVSFVTLLLRDFGVFLRTVQIWPVQQQVIDWEKVDQLLAADDTANALSPPISES